MNESRFKISQHENGYYQVSIPNYKGGEVVTAEAFDALVAAGRRVLDGLNARIQRASEAGGTVPLFDGIGELRDALPAAQANEGGEEK